MISTISRPVLVAMLAGACVSSVLAEGKVSQSQREYNEWIHRYKTAQLISQFPAADGLSTHIEVPLRLIITAIEGDEPKTIAKHPFESSLVTYTYRVAADWRNSFSSTSSRGTKGGGHQAIPAGNRNRLADLLSKLPSDGSRLPPPGRRLLLQVPDGDGWRVRVYDRANAPDEICEILRLSHSGITSWVPQFEPDGDVQAGRFGFAGVLALTPNGQLVSSAGRGELTFWDPVTRKALRELPLPHKANPSEIAYSPDGLLVMLIGAGQHDCFVADTKTWKSIRDLTEPAGGEIWRGLSFPRFSPDGHYLVLQCGRSGVDGFQSDWLRIYDTKTWDRVERLPGVPVGARGFFQLPKGKLAVVLSKDRTLALWDIQQGRQFAKLDEDVRLRQVAFSPDEKLVAIATVHKRDAKSNYMQVCRIRVWKMDTGELLHELRPFEQDVCEAVVGLQWTPDGHYVLAATKSHPVFTNCDIDVWNVKSGRQRGHFARAPSRPMGVVLVPGGRQIAMAGTDRNSIIRFWDFAAAMKRIGDFEASLAKPPAGNCETTKDLDVASSTWFNGFPPAKVVHINR